MKKGKDIKEGKARNRAATIKDAGDVYRIMKSIALKDREHFFALHLNAKNRVINKEVLSIGTLTQSIVHPRETFKRAIAHNSASIILVHNHVSGDPEPSNDDKQTTQRLTKAGDLLNIPVLDHVIIAEEGYFSFRKEGLMIAEARPAEDSFEEQLALKLKVICRKGTTEQKARAYSGILTAYDEIEHGIFNKAGKSTKRRSNKRMV